MSDNNQNIENIEKFLAGKMTANEKSVFEQRLKDDKILMEDYKHMQTLTAGIKASVLEEKMAFLKELEKEEGITSVADDGGGDKEPEEKERETSVNPKSNIRKMFWWFSSVAAVILVLVMVLPIVNSSGPSEEYLDLFENRFETLIKHETMRSSDWVDPYTAEQRRAYNLFAAKEFKKAIPLLEKLWEEKRDSIALEYLGYLNKALIK